MLAREAMNRNMRNILQKIETYCNQNTNNQPIIYSVHLFQANDELNSLKELEELGAISILARKLKGNINVTLYLQTIEPKFSTLCREFEPSNSVGFERENNISEKTMFFPKRFLRQELDQFQSVLRHFVGAGAISSKDYQFLTLSVKMIRKLIEECCKTNNSISSFHSFPLSKISNKHAYFSERKKLYQPSLFSKPQPIPIIGEIVVPGLNERLEALKTENSIDKGPKFPYKIPAGTHWNNVVMKFLDDKRVLIIVKKLRHETDYKEMGMTGKGKFPEPNEQWVFLRVLAQFNGELTIKDAEAKDTYKKHKQTLTETLRNYFSIDYDPFYPYQSSPEKEGNSYKIKLLLIPPPAKDTPKQIMTDIGDSNNDELGIQEYLDENAPLVLDY